MNLELVHNLLSEIGFFWNVGFMVDHHVFESRVKLDD